MTKALKIILILAAIVAFFWGTAMLVLPNRAAAWNNFPELPEGMKYFVGLLGCIYAAWGVGMLLAARDPLKHRTWIQVGIICYGLSLIGTLYYLLNKVISFGQARVGLIVQVVFLAAFIILYPKKKAE